MIIQQGMFLCKQLRVLRDTICCIGGRHYIMLAIGMQEYIKL